MRFAAPPARFSQPSVAPVLRKIIEDAATGVLIIPNRGNISMFIDQSTFPSPGLQTRFPPFFFLYYAATGESGRSRHANARAPDMLAERRPRPTA